MRLPTSKSALEKKHRKEANPVSGAQAQAQGTTVPAQAAGNAPRELILRGGQLLRERHTGPQAPHERGKQAPGFARPASCACPSGWSTCRLAVQDTRRQKKDASTACPGPGAWDPGHRWERAGLWSLPQASPRVIACQFQWP